MSLKKLLLAKTDSNASSVTSSDLEMGGVRSVSVYEGNRTRVKKWSGHSNHAYHYRSHSNTSHRKRKKDLLIIAQEEDYEILGGPTQVYLIKGRGRSFEVVDLSDTCLLKGSWGEEPEEERVVQFTDSQGRLLLTMEHSVRSKLFQTFFTVNLDLLLPGKANHIYCCNFPHCTVKYQAENKFFLVT